MMNKVYSITLNINVCLAATIKVLRHVIHFKEFYVTLNHMIIIALNWTAKINDPNWKHTKSKLAAHYSLLNHLRLNVVNLQLLRVFFSQLVHHWQIESMDKTIALSLNILKNLINLYRKNRNLFNTRILIQFKG